MIDEAALAWAQAELEHLVAIPSTSGQEAALVSDLTDRLTRLGLPVRADPVDGAGANLLIGWDPTPELLLTAHTDTIVPTWDWQSRLKAEGSVVHGLGAQDDKGCVVACLLALLMARDDGVALERLPVGVGLCVDEEVGGSGSKQMASALKPRFVVASEGTELRTATVEAGYVEGWVDVAGTGAHHSFSEEGDNAIERAARLVSACTSAPFTRATHPLGAPNRVSVHAFSSPAAVNVVPDSARFFLDARLFNPTSPEEVIAQLDELCTQDRGTFRPEEISLPFETPTDAPLVQAMLAATTAVLGSSAPPTYMPAWTDAHNFVEVAGAQTVVFGPGHLRSAHGPNEHIDVREIVKAARILAELISHWPTD